MISGRTKLVGLIGNPVEHSLSPAMQNAAFAARGLDWAYVPLLVEDGQVEEAVRGLAALGFVGRERDDAAQGRGRRSVRHRSRLGEHARRPRRPGRGPLDRRGRCSPGSPPSGRSILGSGGAAAAFRAALPDARVFSRRGDWPPEVSDTDLVVNATSERDEVLCALSEGQTLIDLPYPETATGRAAREAGATVITGLEVLVAQGAASFELWTGMPAPVEVMRAAVGLTR